eukprot:jgi/Astpho2/8939/Aster-02618
MGRPFKQYLNAPRIYSCGSCRSHVSDHEEIISKAFQGRHGRAYLFSNAINISLGPSEDRLLITGLHTVADIYCTCCNTVLGWKYGTVAALTTECWLQVRAYEESQRYKEGNYIIEKQRVMKEGW